VERAIEEVRRIAALSKPERHAALDAALNSAPPRQAEAARANAPAMLR